MSESRWNGLAKSTALVRRPFRQFRKGHLSDEWREAFSIFMSQQITRTPVFRRSMMASAKIMAEEFLRLGYSDVARARQMMERYGDPSETETISPESMVEAITGNHITVNVTEAPFLSHMLEHVEFLTGWLHSFNWAVLKAPRETGFIICDYPFVLIPPKTHPTQVGFNYPGTVMLFPIDRWMCLLIESQGWETRFVSISKSNVRLSDLMGWAWRMVASRRREHFTLIHSSGLR
jgi:hypothetical protein